MRAASSQRLGEYDLVVGARTAQTQATVGPADRQRAAEPARQLSHRTAVPDLTSGFRGARREHLREFLHLLPNGFSTPTTTTLAFIKAGYNVTFEPVEARARIGQSKIRFARDGAQVLPDPAEGHHDLQPAARLRPDQRRRRSCSASSTAC